MLIVCAGTGTDVGKTWVGAAVLRRLVERHIPVAARKPAQSFAAGDEGATDADLLAAAVGVEPQAVCPAHRWYPVPMAPPMAAEALGRPPFTLADLAAELAWPSPEPAVRWIESAGGVRSPIAADGDTVALCRLVDPEAVVLVADAGLGTINAIRLSVEALGRPGVVVFLNRYDDGEDLHRRNLDWLAHRCGLDVVTRVEALAARLAGTTGEWPA